MTAKTGAAFLTALQDVSSALEQDVAVSLGRKEYDEIVGRGKLRKELRAMNESQPDWLQSLNG